MSRAAEIDDGEFYAQMKAPTRVRDMSSGEIRYRWVETGSLDHYRHAHALDHLLAKEHWYGPACVGDGMVGGPRLFANYDRLSGEYEDEEHDGDRHRW